LNDREIDGLLKSAKAPPGPAPEVLGRITESIAGSIRPVRPLPRRWLLTGGVVFICAAVSLAGASGLGFHGLIKMSVLERAAVFSVLGILMLAVAGELASAMIPGGLRRFSSGGLLAVTALCLVAVLGASFRNYQTTRFMHAGLVCLSIGLLHAVAAWILGWLVLRRGYAVNKVSAGMAAGTLAGLAGLGMLELHCPNFQAAHVLVWHLGVLLMSAGLGSLWGWGATLSSATRRNGNY
jgi:hypothetical protein